ncbi:hypothetical protein BZL54_19090 [Burkholderia ubonensis subsp. mesacidophila]|uniref:Uncharacterized protein n=2 Tax=Burkholderia ubonensis TaxID=101571 RepID=A0A2A4FCL9_9BURK|nr:hypothetical protein BZL54_19090 [Burkholderia ubonensis subsp. mesacidophila]
MAGRFPGAPDIDAFWRLLHEGRSGLTEFSLRELQESRVIAANDDPQGYVRVRGVLGDEAYFDAGYFGYAPAEAALLDPQARLFLECAAGALEHAGYGSPAHRDPVALFASSRRSEYEHFLLRHLDRETLDSPFALDGTYGDFLALRTSYKLDLRGPSMLVRTACSSSLVALHLACRSLRNREAGMAIAGAASISWPPRAGRHAATGGIISATGHCRPFDARADGTVSGDAVVCVVLKRLDDALAAGDDILAVVLGSASNNDGSDKISFTAPSVDGQVRVIQEALRDAGITASGIGYIEAHGSGTPLGDAIEIQALSEAYRLPAGDDHRIGIGSVKASVGHSDASAGLAGFVRTVLCLRHRTLVPTPGFEAPNPLFDGNDAFLEVHRAARPWTERVIGAVHSVGMGGTNAHVIVGPAPTLPARSVTQAPQLILLSARTQPALDAMRAQLAAHLRSHPDQPFADVAWTLQAGRDARPVRHALVADDPVDAARQLETRIVHDFPETDQDLPLRTGLLFPGMGAADLSAMFALHDEVAAFRRALERRLDALTALSGTDFRHAFASRRATSGTSAGPGDGLDQPIMFALQLSLYDLWRLSSDEPAFVLGYSLGEWTAATVAGVYREDDALALVWERAQLMRAAPSGTLLAVHAPKEGFEPLRVSGIEIAAYCSRRLLIVGGPEAAIAEQAIALERRKIATSRIASPHAYHTGHLRTVAATLDERASRVARRAPRIPFVCLHAGAWADTPLLDDRAYWGRHLADAVRLEDGITLLNRQSRSVLVELGPGSFLGDLVKISGNPSRHAVFSPFAGTGTRGRAAWLHMLGAAWETGLPVDAAPLHDEQPRRVPLPTYPFERQRYVVEAAAPLEGGATRHAGEPADAAHRATPRRTPAAAARHDLYAIWEHVFGAPPPDDDAHFFESGGHSLLAIQFLYFVRERLSVELTVADLRANPTAGALRALIDRSRAADRVEP